MDRYSHVVGVRRRRPQRQQSASSPLLFTSPTRGIKIRAKSRVARYIRRGTGRASRALSCWWATLKSGFRWVKLDSGRAYVRVAQEEGHVRRAPKGHLVVYVGPTVDGGVAPASERVVVPLIYINHPLFKRLLEDAEEKYGFDYPGGLTIPCPVSEFEIVKTRIAMDRVRIRHFVS